MTPTTAILAALALTLLAPMARAACVPVSQAGGDYIACDFDPARARIELHDADASGKPFGGFDPLFRRLLAEGRLPVFAMNGGMYEADLSPVGLYVEKGHLTKPANLRDGFGNFHLKPNGVFWLKAGRARVSETRAFLDAGVQPDLATQSGPMLVIDNRIHPAFLPGSDSLKIRNGVGVDRQGRVHFVISQAPVRFFDMAVLFRDRLDCPNALFLDGSISSLYAPELGRFDRLSPMGPMVVVTFALPRLSF
nr:phosphodiester glycosidase family protein [uncultured Gellertiella sp.]